MSGGGPIAYGYLPGYKNLSALGSTQIDAALVRGGMNVFTNVPAGSGVVLPQSYSADTLIFILNRGIQSQNLRIYPARGSQIEFLTENTPLVIAVGGGVALCCVDSPIYAGQQWWIFGGTGLTPGSGNNIVDPSGISLVDPYGNPVVYP